MSNKIYITRQKRNLGYTDAYLFIKQSVNEVLNAEGVSVPCEVNIMLTDDEGIRKINLEFRGIDSPTDVLSFPFNELTAGGFDEAACEADPSTGRVQLGDIVLSVPRCKAQGEEFGHGFEHEVCYLAVHSTLHLLGYDHMDEGKQKRLMRARENEIMSLLGALRFDKLHSAEYR